MFANNFLAPIQVRLSPNLVIHSYTLSHRRRGQGPRSRSVVEVCALLSPSSLYLYLCVYLYYMYIYICIYFYEWLCVFIAKRPTVPFKPQWCNARVTSVWKKTPNVPLNNSNTGRCATGDHICNKWSKMHLLRKYSLHLQNREYNFIWQGSNVKES